MGKKVIAVIGNSNLFQKMKTEVGKIFPPDDISFIKIENKENQNLSEVMLKIFGIKPDFIFWEFEKVSEKNISMTLLLKNHITTKHIPIVGIFNDKKSLLQNQGMFSYGIVLSYLKDHDFLESFFTAYYITYESPFEFPRFALAEKLSLTATIQAMSMVSYLTPNSIGLELDLILEEDSEPRINLKLVNGQESNKFRVALARPQPPRNFYLNTVEVEIPDNFSWLQSQMGYAQWITENQKDMLQKDISMLVIDHRPSAFSIFLNYFDFEKTFIKFTAYLDQDLETLTEFCPEIIIIQIEENDQIDEENDQSKTVECNNMNLLRHVMNFINGIDNYNPFIIVFNTPSDSEAFRKTFYYSNIMAHPKNFDFTIAPVLIDLYRKSKKSEGHSEKFFFKYLDSRAFVEIPIEITMTSISEHAITFIYNGDLPIFSSFKMELLDHPIYLTLVPPTRSLDSTRFGTHYMAFFSGTDHEDKNVLRQLVSTIQASPPKNIKNVPLSSLGKTVELQKAGNPPLSPFQNILFPADKQSKTSKRSILVRSKI